METENLDSDFPTTITENNWVYAYAPTSQINYRKFKKDKSGKWLVFSDNKLHDVVWQKIKKATQDGVLGAASKAATAKPNPNSTSENEKVICAYTYNWSDIDDVYRVAKALRSIGIEVTLYYKTDSATKEGLYRINGSKSICKYISKATKSYNKIDLGSLSGVGDDKIKNLNGVGIMNIDDLLAFDTSKNLSGMGISSKWIFKLKFLALSQIENKIYQLNSVELPEDDIIHFDIETDLYVKDDVKRVWSIAVHHNKKVKRFFAETWKQEKKILREFLKYLKSNKNAHLFSYSSFDKRVLKCAFTRHKLDVDFFLSCNHYDLYDLIKRNYVFPLGSYSVKQIGNHLGYKFKNENIDGLVVSQFEF